MNQESHFFNRKSYRLKGCDYSLPGAYFITILAKNRECIFGEAIEGKIVLSEIGKIAFEELKNTENIRENMYIDCFVVMPNHVHAIVIISDITPKIIENPGKGVLLYAPTGKMNPFNEYRSTFISPSRNLGAMVRGYKGAVTKKVRSLEGCLVADVWQRNYHDHIIRNQKEYDRICEYIINNPKNWKEDCFF